MKKKSTFKEEVEAKLSQYLRKKTRDTDHPFISTRNMFAVTQDVVVIDITGGSPPLPPSVVYVTKHISNVPPSGNILSFHALSLVFHPLGLYVPYGFPLPAPHIQ